MPAEVLPTVSVCLTTYQHSRFIKQCLDSVLSQKTNFAFEILLGEDSSSDGTREICIEYANKHPDKIRLFLHDRKNVIYIGGKATGRFNFLNNLKKAKGQYLAICEGDDYWTDPLKLQKQFDWLNRHDDYSMVVHDTTILGQDGKTSGNWRDYDGCQFFDLNFVISPLCPFHTSSLFIRASAISKLPNFVAKYPSGDFMLQILAASTGNVFRLPESMSTYRLHAGGISSTSLFKGLSFRLARMELVESYAAYLEGKGKRACYDLLCEKNAVAFVIAMRSKSTLRQKLATIRKLSPKKVIVGLYRACIGRRVTWQSQIAIAKKKQDLMRKQAGNHSTTIMS